MEIADTEIAIKVLLRNHFGRGAGQGDTKYMLKVCEEEGVCRNCGNGGESIAIWNDHDLLAVA